MGEERKLPWETIAWMRLAAAGSGEVGLLGRGGVRPGFGNVWGLESTGFIDGPGGPVGKSHRGKLVDQGLVPLSESECHLPHGGPWGGAGARAESESSLLAVPQGRRLCQTPKKRCLVGIWAVRMMSQARWPRASFRWSGGSPIAHVCITWSPQGGSGVRSAEVTLLL